MSGKTHTYATHVEWTGNRGTGTSAYTAYGREHVIRMDGKPDIKGSSDPAFRGNADRHNPEDMMVAAVSTCHMLWYLHLAAEAKIIVTGYTDAARGTMVEDKERGGYFTEIVLRPLVTISAGDPVAADSLHAAAHQKCYIANSVNFPVRCIPKVQTTGTP
jgi:organic hydroperoxide reductase OsmC/OhrA